jgi:type III secretion protein L
MVGVYRLKTTGFKLAGGSHVIPGALFDAIDRADQIVASAEAEAERIRGEAQLAYEQEKQRGRAEGLQQAQIEAIGRLVEETGELDRALAAAEGDLARLVVAAVKKIIADYDDLARAEAVVRSALAHMRREKRAELSVAPALADALRGRIGVILADYPDMEFVEVTADPSLGEGQIVLQSAIGRVDGDLAQRLDELETVIRAAHARLTADPLDNLTVGGRPDGH